MKDIKVGDVYFYNNGKVTILKIETEDFVLVEGDKDIHTEINGSEFCTACLVGGHGNHKCDDADMVIESVVEDISDKDIFWVNVKHLQNEPFEYKKWKKITEENKKLLADNDSLKEKNIKLSKEIEEFEKKKNTFLKDISDLESIKSKIETDIEEGKSVLKKVILDKEEVIKLNSSNIKLSLDQILEYIVSHLTLEYLEAGGVDNWEWYGESLPDCEDFDEYINNEAIEFLVSKVNKK